MLRLFLFLVALAVLLVGVVATADGPTTIVLDAVSGTVDYSDLGVFTTISAKNTGANMFWLKFEYGGVLSVADSIPVLADGTPTGWEFNPADGADGVRVIVPNGDAYGYITLGGN